MQETVRNYNFFMVQTRKQDENGILNVLYRYIKPIDVQMKITHIMSVVRQKQTDQSAANC